MKISWRLRLTLVIMATVAGAITVTWILNRFLLEKYYVNTKIDALKSTYESIEDILSKYYVAEEGNQSADAGTGRIIVTSNTKVVQSSETGATPHLHLLKAV